MNIFVTSDSHFGHAKIIQLASRPFSCVEEMNEALIERWNSVVRPHDHVYHLGDVAINEGALAFIARLNGHLRLCMGNHDIFGYKKYAEAGFKKIMAMRVMEKKGPYAGLILTHVPIHERSMFRFALNVHGHTHETSYGLPYVNVSVEQTDYTPVSLDDICAQHTGLIAAWREVHAAKKALLAAAGYNGRGQHE